MTISRHSLEWVAIKRRNLIEIEKHRLELEGLDITPDRAQQLRGMIFALREQIEHVEPRAAAVVEDVNYA